MYAESISSYFPIDTPDRAARAFAHFYKDEDIPNSILAWDGYADHRYQKMLESDGAPINLELPSIVSAFMPKSGGTFIFNRQKHNLGYKEFWWGIVHENKVTRAYPTQRALELYLRGGCVTHSHFLPTPYALKIFRAAGVEKFWVHLRNPAEAAISAYYHFKGEGQGRGEIAEQRRHLNAAQLKASGMSVRTDSNEDLDDFVLNVIDNFISWAKSWLDFAGASDAVVFTFYSELTDPRQLFERVSAEFGISVDIGQIADDLPEDRRRTGTRKPWREQLASATAEVLEKKLIESLADYEIPELVR